MPVKAVFSDLDGTLLLPDGTCSPATIKAVEQLHANNILLTAVTGRSYREVRDVFEKLHLTTPAVFNGGASIIDPTSGSVLHQSVISTQLTASVIGHVANLCEFVSFGSGIIRADGFRSEMVQGACLSIWVECNPTRATDVANILKQIPGIVAYVNDIAQNGRIGIQINNDKADKKHGAQLLMQSLGLSASEVMAIGNDHNDVPLFNAVGTSVAMGDAPESLKATANYVVADVLGDGFAEAIDKFLLSAR